MAKKSRNKKLNKANLRYANIDVTAATSDESNGSEPTSASAQGAQSQAERDAAKLRALQERKAQQAQVRKDKAAKKLQKSGEVSKSSRKAHPAEKKPGVFKRIINYFKAVVGEIKLTTWPTRNEVLNMSIIVVGVLLFFGILIFVLDWILSSIMVQYANLTDAVNPSTDLLPQGGADGADVSSDGADTQEPGSGYANSGLGSSDSAGSSE